MRSRALRHSVRMPRSTVRSVSTVTARAGGSFVEAAARCSDAAFVVTSSGPGVTPGEQERWAARGYMTRAGLPEGDVDEVGRYYDRVISMMRSRVSLRAAREQLETDGFPQAFETLALPVLPDDEAEWRLLAAMIDYDPRPALERIAVPVLALFGAEDPVTPVEDSIVVFREAVRPDLLHVEVFPGAGHRLEIGDPPMFVHGYFETLTSFILRAAV